MDIYEAAKTGVPFTHPDMIGAYAIIDGKNWVHRDNPKDFLNESFIRAHCLGFYGTFGLDAQDITRNDWYLINLEEIC